MVGDGVQVDGEGAARIEDPQGVVPVLAKGSSRRGSHRQEYSVRVKRLGMPLRPTNRATPSAGMMRERRPMPHSLRANRAQLAGIRPELRRLSAGPAKSRRARSGVNRNRPSKAHVRSLPVPPRRLRDSCAAGLSHDAGCAGHPAEGGAD